MEEGLKASMACERERDCHPRLTTSRKPQSHNMYVPVESIRNRATPPKKRGRRNKYAVKRGRPKKANTKKTNKKNATQTTLVFPVCRKQTSRYHASVRKGLVSVR